eukprot:gene7337-10002_t
MNSSILLLIFTIFCSSAASEETRPITHYKTWCQGSCDRDAVTTTKPGLVMMGGGTDTDEAFLWQIQNANKGDFVVLRTSGDDAYNPYIYELSVAAKSVLNSVTTILFYDKQGSAEKEVLTILRNAEAIFLAGGDQSEYLDYWVGTEVQSIIQSKLANVTVGGTSAGCMVQGNYVYSAEKGSITSDEALANPYDKYLTVVPAFLKVPFLDSFVTDTHFVTRDRMGRMVTFMSRIYQDGMNGQSTYVRGVGIDEHTALLLDVTNGDITAVGVSTAYVCSSDHKAQICKSGTPLTYQGLSCVRLSGRNGDTYSFSTFKGSSTAVNYDSDVVKGTFTNNPYGPL